MNFLQDLEYGEIKKLGEHLMSKGFEELTPNGFQKAFAAGEGVGTAMVDLSQLTGGRAITIENIDTELKVTAERRRDLKWYNLIRNKPIYAVLDQYVVLSDHGVNSRRHTFGKFTSESAFPKTSDITLERKVDATKFIRDMRDLTHVAEVTQTFAEKHQIINRAAAITVLEAQELCTGFGNSNAIPNQYDGLFIKLVDAYNAGFLEAIVDCRKTGASSKSQGTQVTETELDQGAESIMNSYGAATHMVMPTKVKSDLNDILPVSRRVMLPSAQGRAMGDLLLGVPAAGFYSDFAYSGWGKGGDPHFDFVPSIDTFFPSGESAAVKAPTADFPNGTDAPAQPTGVTAAVAGSGSKFGAGDTGLYFYKVSSLNADGESISVPIDAGASITVAAGQEVTLTIAATDATITGYSIFRSALAASDSTDCRWIADIKATNPTGDTTFVDKNLILPGTSQAFLISNAPETDALDYRQLLPFVRMELPFGLNNIVGYPYLYMLYSYLRTAKLRNKRTNGTYHVLYTNIRWTNSKF